MIADAIASMFDWRPKNATIENPTFSLNDPAAFASMFGGVDTDSGIKVTHDKALSIGVVWQGVSTISGDVATSTMNIFKVLPEDDREIDWSHDCQTLVSVQPNDEMSAFEFWRRLMVHALLWQNGYGFILREGRAPKGRTLALLNLLPDRTCPMRHDDGTLYYASEVDGKMEPFRADEIIHVKGISVDGSTGCDLIAHAREAMGLALAAQGFGAKFFKNGAQSGGFLEIPATFTEKAKETLEIGFDKKFAGPANWFKAVILRDGAKFHESTIDPQKSQMHELREDQVRDLARFLGLPPSKVGLSDSVSYNSQEQSEIAYLKGCLNHWFAAIRGECNIKLLRANERASGKWYCEHNVTKLLEPDIKTMNEVLNIQRAAEIINADEWRRKIGLNKRPDGKGGEYVNPNTKSNTPASEPKTDPVSPPDQKQKPDKNKPTKAMRDLFCETVGRFAHRACNEAREESKSLVKFEAWVEGKIDSRRQMFADGMRSVVNVIDSVNVEVLTWGIVGVFYQTFGERMEPLIQPPNLATKLVQNVDTQCVEFEATIAGHLADLIFEKDVQ